MIRFASLALVAALASGVAHADPITYTNTAFTGQTTDLTSVGTQFSSPYTDSYNNVLDFSNVQGEISAGYGLIFGAESGDTTSVTLTLAASTTKLGLTWNTDNFSGSGGYLTSATFSDGTFTDTFSGGSLATTSLNSVSSAFMNFSDDRAFTTVTLNFHYASSKDYDTMSGFVTPASVPEPVVIVNLAIAAAMGFGFRTFRRRLMASASSFDNQDSHAPTPA